MSDGGEPLDRGRSPGGISPSGALRRWTVVRELRRLPGRRVLEIGCGRGDLAAELITRGYDVSCVEPSGPARAAAAARFETLGSLGRVVPIVPETSRLEGSFDVVVACEVLEHVEDDLAEIRSWADRLRSGAALIVTVPAHPERFGPSDVWAGHVRRYRRDELVRLATSAGLDVRRLVCFGFPFGNVVEPIRHRVHARRLRRERASSPSERTARSGIERGFESRLGAGWWLLPFCWIQLPFFSTDRGTSYLLVGTRR